MLKIIFFLNFMVMIINKKNFWMFQNFFLLIYFFLLLNSVNMKIYVNLISFFLGCDILSYGLILLTLWISSLMITASEQIYKFKNSNLFFKFNILLLVILLLLTFMSMNLFMFYMFFEGSLIPTLILIFGWGYQPERLQAGIYLLFYTLLVSLPMLIGIFYLYMYMLNFNFYLLYMYSFDFYILYLCMILAFLVKMPMFLIHLWLPKAHVEAPVSGSMILAGIMLKLGGYGMLRLMMLFKFINYNLNFFFISISLVGGLLISLICLQQVDLKSLIAYSSVAHMGMVLSGLMTLNNWGLIGAYILMIAHGLCSSGLFCLANISYERVGSRSMLINKGMLNFMPSMALWWFLLCSFNMAAPPSLNLMGEIFLLNSIISWSLMSLIILLILAFFSVVYTLYLFTYSQHGKFFSGLYSFKMEKIREFLLLMMHWIPLNLLIMEDNFFNMF